MVSHTSVLTKRPHKYVSSIDTQNSNFNNTDIHVPGLNLSSLYSVTNEISNQISNESNINLKSNSSRPATTRSNIRLPAPQPISTPRRPLTSSQSTPRSLHTSRKLNNYNDDDITESARKLSINTSLSTQNPRTYTATKNTKSSTNRNLRNTQSSSTIINAKKSDTSNFLTTEDDNSSRPRHTNSEGSTPRQRIKAVLTPPSETETPIQEICYLFDHLDAPKEIIDIYHNLLEQSIQNSQPNIQQSSQAVQTPPIIQASQAVQTLQNNHSIISEHNHEIINSNENTYYNENNRDRLRPSRSMQTNYDTVTSTQTSNINSPRLASLNSAREHSVAELIHGYSIQEGRAGCISSRRHLRSPGDSPRNIHESSLRHSLQQPHCLCSRVGGSCSICMFGRHGTRRMARDAHVDIFQRTLFNSDNQCDSEANTSSTEALFTFTQQPRMRFRNMFLRGAADARMDGDDSRRNRTGGIVFQDADFGEILRARATERQVSDHRHFQALPTAPFDAQNTPPAECSICLCPYEDTEQLRYLPCLHYFHVQCVDQWFQRSRHCPICKFSL